MGADYTTIRHRRARHLDGSGIESGDDLAILAHRENPEETRVFLRVEADQP